MRDIYVQCGEMAPVCPVACFDSAVKASLMLVMLALSHCKGY